MPDRIYLDHAATTPMRPEAVAAVAEGMARWANPSSPHAEGRAARAALEGARERIKAALGWNGELIFTSGASEALAIALGRAKGGRRLVSAVEHDAVFRAAPGAGVLPVAEGRVNEQALDDALHAGDRPVVAVQHVNPETGFIQPIDEIAAVVRAAGGVLVCDCAQSAGKLRLPDADLIVISSHKLGGPPGEGALLVRDAAMLEPTGGQERGYRAGTENLPGALGFAAALEAVEWHDATSATWIGPLVSALLDLEETIADGGGCEIRFGRGWHSILISAFAMPQISAAAQLIHFDAAGFAVSAGSACSSGSLKPSRALKAFDVPDEVAGRTIRVSMGWNTTVAEVEAFGEAWRRIAREAGTKAA